MVTQCVCPLALRKVTDVTRGTDVAAGGLSGRLAQLGVVIRVRAVLRRHTIDSGPRGRMSDEASFEAHVDQALRVARGLPPLHVVSLDEGVVARSGT